MEIRRSRNILPALYAMAVVLAFLSASGTVLVAVIVVGAMVVGAGYAAMSGGAGRARPEREARRATRHDRRGS